MTVDWDDRDTHVQPDHEAAAARDLYADYSAGTQASMAVVDEEKINYELMVDLLGIIAAGDDPGAVLVFLPGLREIQVRVYSGGAVTAAVLDNRLPCFTDTGGGVAAQPDPRR